MWLSQVGTKNWKESESGLLLSQVITNHFTQSNYEHSITLQNMFSNLTMYGYFLFSGEINFTNHINSANYVPN